jgi:hypothetical protein
MAADQAAFWGILWDQGEIKCFASRSFPAPSVGPSRRLPLSPNHSPATKPATNPRCLPPIRLPRPRPLNPRPKGITAARAIC